MANKLISKPDLCVNCRMCEMACSLMKTGMFNPAKARIWIYQNHKDTVYPMICRHCVSPPCEKACPVEGKKPIRRSKESGIVFMVPEGCIGCYECVGACPFNAIRIDPETDAVIKCDLCGGDPECAKWCPTGALQYVDTKAMTALKASEKNRQG
ncbi:MAG: 4Fe-4S dicluster domain-containing protein [Desulfobacterales bacterium]